MRPVYYAASVLRHDLRRLKKLRKALLIVAVVSLVAMPVPVVAQQQVGGFRVLVIDQTVSVIPGAEVEFGSRVLIRAVFGVSDDQGLVIRGT